MQIWTLRRYTSHASNHVFSKNGYTHPQSSPSPITHDQQDIFQQQRYGGLTDVYKKAGWENGKNKPNFDWAGTG